MKFNKLKLGSKSVKKQLEFYADILGFEIIKNTSDELEIRAGLTKFAFSEKLYPPDLYHFCFLIPTGSLESSIQFLDSRDIDLLPFEGENIIHFDTGRSIYFFDPDGNIAEFIERPSLDYPIKQSFDINDIICVNEIGLPVANTLDMSHKLMTYHGIEPINPKTWNEKFCWVGDHEGAVIVVKEGRHWMPTELPAVINDFELEYVENGAHKTIQCKSGKLIT
ncbi:VOC family protein [Reichenbachiella sp.]|uniref:VOC family protein n=1 Tax=Reichenbachiella sp. TaxID=2184521 RepID=UPI003B5CDEAB